MYLSTSRLSSLRHSYNCRIQFNEVSKCKQYLFRGDTKRISSNLFSPVKCTWNFRVLSPARRYSTIRTNVAGEQTGDTNTPGQVIYNPSLSEEHRV